MTRSLGTFVMVGASLAVIFGSAAALAQKQGGTLRVHALDSPPSLSMHEETDAVPARATMGLFNNLVMFDQRAKQNNTQSIVPRSGHRLVMERGRNRTDLPIARGGQMARRQALHCRRCQMHLGSAHRQVEPEASSQSAQVLVPQPRGSDHQRRL